MIDSKTMNYEVASQSSASEKHRRDVENNSSLTSSAVDLNDGLPTLTEEHRDLPGISTRQLPIKPSGPFDGRTLGDTAMRTRTGVSVVAVARAGQVHPSPAPDFTLTGGDLLVAVGTSEGLEAAVKILKYG